MGRNNRSRKTTRFSRNDESPNKHSGRTYSVGYGQPPVASRFKPGVSGNVKGRPKGGKNLKTLLWQAMTGIIAIQEGSKTRRLTKIEGVVLRQLQNALKGDDKSATAVVKMATQLGFLEEASTPAETTTLSAADEQILQELFSRRRNRTKGS